MRTCWLFLCVGILCEIIGTTTMRALNVSHPAASQIVATVGIILAYGLISRAVEKLPIGLAYAIWSGVGTGGISLLSWWLFAEPMPPLKIIGVLLVIIGMVVINTDKGESHA